MDVQWALRARVWGAVPRPADRELRCFTARRRDELRAAFRLVYDRYCGHGLAEPNRLGLRILPHQLLETSWVLLAARGRHRLGTLSLIEDGALGLPIELHDSTVVERLRRQRTRVAELACLASCGHRGGQNVTLLRALLQSAIQLACRQEIEELVICVHPRYAHFYERRLGFRELGPPRCCPWVCDQPGVAMSLSLHATSLAAVPLALPASGFKSPATDVEPAGPRRADREYFRRLLDETSPIASPGRRALVA